MKIEQLLDEYFKEFTQGSEGKLHAHPNTPHPKGEVE